MSYLSRHKCILTSHNNRLSRAFQPFSLRTRPQPRGQQKIDAITALSLGVTADERCKIYWTEFPVMRRYDQENWFDNRTLDWVGLEKLTVIAEGRISYAYTLVGQ